jgi:pSer/pThr/pTyr-binding forkhead associated (FHA) protein
VISSDLKTVTPEIALTVVDAFGRERQVAVRSRRFNIGRSPDNDLVIDDPGISRRHSLIECFEGVIQISDCGSQQGTYVNGRQVVGAVPLKDGDRISIGPTSDIRIHITAKIPVSTPSLSQTPTPPSPRRAEESAPGRDSLNNWFSFPVIMVAAIAVFLIAGGLLIAYYRSIDHNGTINPGNENGQIADTGGNEEKEDEKPDTDTNSTKGQISIEEIEKASEEIVHRISSDDKPYVFPESALIDIRRKLEQYRTSAVAKGAVGFIDRHRAEIAAMAHQEGIEPDLVIYTSLAEAITRGAGKDPAQIVRSVLPDLLWLRATFGSGLADGSLIIVAAYRMGVGTKKTHPLLATMRRIVKNPLVERNVWYLYEHGGIDAQTYDFVISFLAIGVLAQNPAQFDVAVKEEPQRHKDTKVISALCVFVPLWFPSDTGIKVAD